MDSGGVGLRCSRGRRSKGHLTGMGAGRLDRHGEAASHSASVSGARRIVASAAARVDTAPRPPPPPWGTPVACCCCSPPWAGGREGRGRPDSGDGGVGGDVIGGSKGGNIF